MRSLIVLGLLLSFSVLARTNDALMRESWTRDLKTLLAQIENQEPQLLVVSEKKLLLKFSLIASAWADSRFNCFYGGWPSVLRSSGGKKLCQMPTRSNPNYNQGSCRKSEIQCQPMLFDKGLCVPFGTAEERRSSYSNCEKKFQAKGGNYSFLDSPSEKDLLELQEISSVAGEVCGPQSDSPQKNTIICKNIIKKLPNGLKSIQQGVARDTASVEPGPVPEVKKEKVVAVEPVKEKAVTRHNEDDCDEPSHSHREVQDFAKNLGQVANSSLDSMYEDMKQKFQNSPFCKPENVMNDPGKQPSGVFIRLLERDLRGLEYSNNIEDILSRYEVSSSARSQVLSFASQIKSNSGDAKTLRARMKAVFYQDVLRNKDLDMSKFQKDIANELVKDHVFKMSDSDEPECPFVSKDAFMKAMKGRGSILSKYKGSVKLPDQITIVDYSRPSNERRMFVLDLDQLEVLHNTWVSHGIGSSEDGGGSDGLGGSPEMSNANGSLKSSDGFILAGKASHGSTFGDNVILNGIDKNNSNLAGRAVVMHEWITPMEDYSIGARQYDRSTKNFSTPVDTVQQLRNIDPNTASTREIENAIFDMTDATRVSKYMATTEGCLGVSGAVMKHLDKKKRNVSQLEALRQDLPGSIIFNYSGPEMDSNFF
ncbi:murein L,D-transpeptidase catalytic domain-containing protein [Peredibacter sp. HCB2-198]|uniref:murein L,D-transpeptidase catalytic domain-containing protein n=1 Tax=Peredibacter sp. HCB2-198 TaxID=3383025 RepID=UPI0038B451F7